MNTEAALADFKFAVRRAEGHTDPIFNYDDDQEETE